VREGFLWLRKRVIKKEAIDEEIENCTVRIKDYVKNLRIQPTHDVTSKLGFVILEKYKIEK
jgi:hypothetical protein